MREQAIKRVCKRLHRIADRSLWAVPNQTQRDRDIAVGRLAATLIPVWLESDVSTFHAFLIRYSWGSAVMTTRIAMLGMAWHEFPHETFWERWSGEQLALMARLDMARLNETLDRYDVSAIDRLALVSRRGEGYV